jgi:beta-glucosidase
MLLSWLTLTAGGAAYSGQAAVNPDFLYFSKGDTPDGWHWVLADPGNWWMPLQGNEGVSEGKKLVMEPSDSPKFTGAIKLAWSKKENWGGAIITGRSVDLSAYENTAELVLALKLDTRARKPVYIKMTCGDKCEAQVAIHDHLKKATLNEWFALPIPLDCFVAQGADLKNITSPFSVGTDGRMVLHIAEVSVRAMAADDEGCLPNSDAISK